VPLGTLDRTPPPFFRQGPSATTKLAVCTALAVFLMAADKRFDFVVPLRAGLATALLPVQQALRVPVELAAGGSGYLQGLTQAQAEARAARLAQATLAEKAARADALAAENAQLRSLLALAPALLPRHQAAEVMFEARDPYSRKIFIDRGLTQGVRPGAPVIEPGGVLGQVTRAYPLSSEVTLLSDRDAAIPVLNRRTRQRAAAFGGLRGDNGATMELRFLSANADVQVGDELETSGLDGIYPPGLKVATVSAVERRVEGGFARVQLVPAAAGDGIRHVLVLEPMAAQRPEIPAPAASAASAPAKAGSGSRRAGP
jgi:rod shape-determining protein MreC